MCIAVPGEIIDILHSNKAKINIMGVETIINIQLIQDVKIGEYVLVHAGCAIEKINKNYFFSSLNMFKNLYYEDEKRDGQGFSKTIN